MKNFSTGNTRCDGLRGSSERDGWELGLCDRIIAVELCDCNAGWDWYSFGNWIAWKKGVGWLVRSMDFLIFRGILLKFDNYLFSLRWNSEINHFFLSNFYKLINFLLYSRIQWSFVLFFISVFQSNLLNDIPIFPLILFYVFQKSSNSITKFEIQT